MKAGEEFFNIHTHGLVRVAVGTPALRVADPTFNAEQAVAKVGSGGALSPRGDWRAPSDAEATAWLAQLALIPEVE